MSWKRYTPEPIFAKLREAEVGLSQGDGVGVICRSLGISEQSDYGEIFYALKEAKALIERSRQHGNTIRPLSSLGYTPPAPETVLPAATPGLAIAPDSLIEGGPL